MMQLGQVSEHVMSLDGVRQSQHDGLLRWMVKGRLLARQLDDRSIVIRSGFAERERLLAEHPETFAMQPRFEAHQMVVTELAGASAAAVRDALDAAWSLQTTDRA